MQGRGAGQGERGELRGEPEVVGELMHGPFCLFSLVLLLLLPSEMVLEEEEESMQL